MAHTKAKGTTKLGRDSQSQRLGVKIYGGSPIKCGQIIIRQRGTAYFAGDGVKTGKDDTLYAVKDGVVLFKKVRYANFNGNKHLKQRVSVIPAVIASTAKQSDVLVTLSAVEGSALIATSPKAPRNDEIETQVEGAKEEVFIEKVQAEVKEAANAKSKSEYIAQEQPIKSIPMRKETKK